MSGNARALLAATATDLQGDLRDIVYRLTLAVDKLHADSMEVTANQATHKPLAVLAEAGELDSVLALLEALADRPTYVAACLELVSGSPLELVAKCLPGHDLASAA